jgi:hypothetical protein
MIPLVAITYHLEHTATHQPDRSRSYATPIRRDRISTVACRASGSQGFTRCPTGDIPGRRCNVVGTPACSEREARAFRPARNGPTFDERRQTVQIGGD